MNLKMGVFAAAIFLTAMGCGALIYLVTQHDPPPTPAREIQEAKLPTPTPASAHPREVQQKSWARVGEGDDFPDPPKPPPVPSYIHDAAAMIARGTLRKFVWRIPDDHAVGQISGYYVVRIVDDDSMVATLTKEHSEEEFLLEYPTAGKVDGRRYSERLDVVATGTTKVDFRTMFRVHAFTEDEESELNNAVNELRDAAATGK